MKINLSGEDLHKILVEKYGDCAFELYLQENHQLLCAMWNRGEGDMLKPAIRKTRTMSVNGFSGVMVSLVDKRIDPARYGSSDISADEKEINDEVYKEGAMDSQKR